MEIFNRPVKQHHFFIKMGMGLITFATATGFAADTTPVRTYLKQNRLAEATTICRQVEVLSTKNLDDFKACAWVYYRSGQSQAGDGMRLQLKGQGGPEGKLLTAYSYILREKYSEARKMITEVEKETKGTPFSIDAQELSAELYERQGQVDTAAFIYKLIIGDDASRTKAHWGLAQHYIRQKDFRRAILHLEATAKNWPKHLESRYELGALYYKQSAFRRAGKWLAEGYKLNRANPKILEYLGLLFEKKNRLEDAVKYWQRSVDLDPKNAKISKEKLTLYYRQFLDEQLQKENFDAALELVELSRKVDPENPDLLLRRGVIFRRLGKYQKAAGDIGAYLQSNPKDSYALRELGICYINLEITDEAGMAFSQSLLIQPEDGETHAWIAYVYETKGEYGRARLHWKKAIKYLKDPVALKKATRKLATIESRMKKKKKKDD